MSEPAGPVTVASETSSSPSPPTSLPFGPVTSSHILNCSFHSWYPRLRSKTPKARLIELSQPFLNYLRSDGILLPPEPAHDGDSGYSDDEDDPSQEWSQVHQKIYDTIDELGGKVVPKLNWSAPKDATFMSTTNDMECRTPNDIYLLLKSSDFITHDLEHPFDDCTIDTPLPDPIPYHLALRKSFQLNPSLEFRCFVRNKRIIAISQREMNHFPFLFELRSQFKTLIVDNIPDFPDSNFVVDVYLPPPHEKVWIIDINPWAPRTDPLLFSWLELLTLPEPMPDTIFDPEVRLVERDDPEAYQFASTKYSAHKLPRDVVDASMTPSAMKDMMEEWRRVQLGEVGDDSEDDGTVQSS